MALQTDQKLYIALGVLVVLAGALYYQNKKQKEEAATYSYEGRKAELPKIGIKEEDSKKVDKITITQPPGDAGAATEVELTKKGEDWQLTKPLAAKANQTNVKSLIDNLKTLEITEEINPGTDAYAKYGVSDDKAVHATFYKGGEKLAEFFFGDGGTRGQMTRVAGKDGVYAVKGYSSFLYSRDIKGWRDLSIMTFDDSKVKSVEIANENGTFYFTKTEKADKATDGGKAQASWSAKFKKAKAAAATELKDFDESKLKSMLSSYKALNADGFAEAGKKPEDLGLAEPTATVTLTMDDGATKVLKVGGTAEGTSHWLAVEGMNETFSVASYLSDWATANTDKFAKGKEGGSTPPPHGMPGGMPGMPGMGGME